MVRRREDLKIICHPLTIYGWRVKDEDIPPTPKISLPMPREEQEIIDYIYFSSYKNNHTLLPENQIYKNQKKRKLTLSNLMWS